MGATRRGTRRLAAAARRRWSAARRGPATAPQAESHPQNQLKNQLQDPDTTHAVRLALAAHGVPHVLLHTPDGGVRQLCIGTEWRGVALVVLAHELDGYVQRVSVGRFRARARVLMIRRPHAEAGCEVAFWTPTAAGPGPHPAGTYLAPCENGVTDHLSRADWDRAVAEATPPRS